MLVATHTLVQISKTGISLTRFFVCAQHCVRFPNAEMCLSKTIILFSFYNFIAKRSDVLKTSFRITNVFILNQWVLRRKNVLTNHGISVRVTRMGSALQSSHVGRICGIKLPLKTISLPKCITTGFVVFCKNINSDFGTASNS